MIYLIPWAKTIYNNSNDLNSSHTSSFMLPNASCWMWAVRNLQWYREEFISDSIKIQSWIWDVFFVVHVVKTIFCHIGCQFLSLTDLLCYRMEEWSKHWEMFILIPIVSTSISRLKCCLSFQCNIAIKVTALKGNCVVGQLTVVGTWPFTSYTENWYNFALKSINIRNDLWKCHKYSVSIRPLSYIHPPGTGEGWELNKRQTL